jgi:hypothetical protein
MIKQAIYFKDFREYSSVSTKNKPGTGEREAFGPAAIGMSRSVHGIRGSGKETSGRRQIPGY